MTGWGVVAVALAALAAGTINAIVGSGTLVTFPVLLSLGLPPVDANVTNSIGLVPGNVASTWGYRSELAGQRALVSRLAPASLLGAVTGAVVLLLLPGRAFESVVPWLIGLAVALMLIQPLVQARLGGQGGPDAAGMPRERRRSVALLAWTFLCGVYGGYFGAAQGVILIGLMGVLLPLRLQRINAVKNVLVLLVNVTAAVTYLATAPQRIHWDVVGVMAAATIVGGWLGARVGRRLPAPVLRAIVAAVGITAIVVMLA